jgi:hypothetical protein
VRFPRATRHVELANAIERFLGDWRAGGGVDIKEFALHMRPATGFEDATAGEQLIEPSITVGMDDAAELLQMRMRPWRCGSATAPSNGSGCTNAGRIK